MSNDILQLVSKLSSDMKMFDNFLSATRSGDNKVLHKVISEAIKLEESWVNTLEHSLYFVELVVKSPSKHIAEDEIIVDVERARRTTAKTIRHLSSNSKYIRSYEDDNVVPSKLLTSESREELAIYENRFVYSLIKRMIIFVEQRYNDIVGHLDMYDMQDISLESSFNYGGNDITAKLAVNIKEQPHDTVLLEHNSQLMERINNVRKRLRLLEMTDFCKSLASSKPVRPPIVKTNMLKMNVNYSNCYKLWLFLSSYKLSGYSVEISEKDLPLDTSYYDDLTTLVTMSIHSLISNNIISKDKFDSIPFKPKKSKKYKIVTRYDAIPAFLSDYTSKSVGEINEFYFVKMQELLVKKAESQEQSDTIQSQKTLSTNFVQFARNIAAINQQMYESLIRANMDVAPMIRRSLMQRKRDAIVKQQGVAKKYSALSKIVRQEADKVAKKAIKEEERLAKLQLQLKEMKDKKQQTLVKQKQSKEKASQQAKAKKIKAADKAKKLKAADKAKTTKATAKATQQPQSTSFQSTSQQDIATQ